MKIYKNNAINFLESTAIKAFPCGRRGYLPNTDPNNKADYYFQLDPEARLNTEFTNRKITGTNGFTQTFIQECTYTQNENNAELKLALVIAGYNFEILLTETETEPLTEDLTEEYFLASICNDIAGTTPNNPSDDTTIYAFISIDRSKAIISNGNHNVYTEILQSLKDANTTYLDFCDDTKNT